MPKSINSFSNREKYSTLWWSEFLWWLSTAEKELILPCVVDRNRYKIIGATVLATWGFATLAWTYFWSTITTNLFMATSLGVFMGLIILTIDRALIKGINKFNKTKAAPLILRGILAVTLGTFMAQPAILYMFDKEIKVQASLDNEIRKRVKQQELDSLFNPQKVELDTKRSALQKQLNDRISEVDGARKQYIAEIDGSGGTGKIGIKSIALAKKDTYLKLDQQQDELITQIQPQLSSIDSSLGVIDQSKSKANAAFESLLNDGFLTRIQALNNLVKDNLALKWRYFLIVIILMLIELMPVLAKTLLPSGTYDEKVRLVEQLEKEMAENNHMQEKELKILYNQLAKENDASFLKLFFESSVVDRKAKMQADLASWKTSPNDSFDNLWEKMKKEVLTKQEH